MLLRFRFGATLLTAALVLGGCASPARMEKMSADTSDFGSHVPPDTPLKGELRVGPVLGGKSTSPLWTSQVSNEGFRAALEASLRNAQLLAELQSQADYELTATLVKVDQPLVGASMTVTTTVSYRLQNTRTREIVFDENIEAPYTAAFDEAFLGAERLRIANEGSVKSNIGKLIQRLYQLKIEPGKLSTNY